MPTELIHTMIRVLDEERSLAFYRAFGFEECLVSEADILDGLVMSQLG